MESAKALGRNEPSPSAAWGPLLDLWDEVDAATIQPWLANRIGARARWKRPSPNEPAANLPPSPLQTWMVGNTVNWWIHTSWLGLHLGWTRAGPVWGIMGWTEWQFPEKAGKIRTVRSDIRRERIFGIGIEGGAQERLRFGLGGGGAWGALGVRLAEAVVGLSHVKEERCAFQAEGCLGWFAVTRACPSNRRPCCEQAACRKASAAMRQRERRARQSRRRS